MCWYCLQIFIIVQEYNCTYFYFEGPTAADKFIYAIFLGSYLFRILFGTQMQFRSFTL
jgi:hypothetical protein